MSGIVYGTAVWTDPETGQVLTIVSSDTTSPGDGDLVAVAQALVQEPNLTQVQSGGRYFTVQGDVDADGARRFLAQVQAGGQTTPVTPGN